MSFADRTLVCRECGREFTFTAGEQEFFAQKGFTNEPGRCPECRAARKQRMASGSGASYDTGSYSGGGYGGGRREMFTAICSECGQTAYVPFQPRTDKPVYCSSCFERVRSYR
ncbi:MAG: zinc-ribbon domain containing protein [Chloroflexi bacterium]|nr:zinc-ribbon domain containing protein [Chloroflexota bacterium]